MKRHQGGAGKAGQIFDLIIMDVDTRSDGRGPRTPAQERIQGTDHHATGHTRIRPSEAWNRAPTVHRQTIPLAVLLGARAQRDMRQARTRCSSSGLQFRSSKLCSVPRAESSPDRKGNAILRYLPPGPQAVSRETLLQESGVITGVTTHTLETHLPLRQKVGETPQPRAVTDVGGYKLVP